MTDTTTTQSSPPDQSPPQATPPAQQEKKTSTIVYRAQPGDPLQTTWHGVTFVSGADVTTDDEVLIEAARHNPHFDVDGEDKAKARDERVRDAARIQAEGQVANYKAQAAEMEARQEQEMDALEAKHQAERDAFENSTSKAWNDAQAVIDRGGDPAPRSDQSQSQSPHDDQPDQLPPPDQPPATGASTSAVGSSGPIQDDINQKSPENKAPQAAALDGAQTLPSVDEPMPLPQSTAPGNLSTRKPR